MLLFVGLAVFFEDIAVHLVQGLQIFLLIFPSKFIRSPKHINFLEKFLIPFNPISINLTFLIFLFLFLNITPILSYQLIFSLVIFLFIYIFHTFRYNICSKKFDISFEEL